MINFNVPPFVGKELEYLQDAIQTNRKLSGDGPYTTRCHDWFRSKLDGAKTLLTTSCTHALEMAAILLDVQPGDEVIAPSFTFVSTVNAFVLRGAKIRFVDIRPDTMNIDEKLIEAAITPRTRVIVVVHYAGVSCEMDPILTVAKRHGLAVVEDAAQGVMARYKDRPLGTLGDFGTFSFHETKNYSCGEGGALVINDSNMGERAEVIREKGTNRSRFFRGQVDKYTWVDVGSSYLPSELNAAYLYAQLERADDINGNRLRSWQRYFEGLSELESEGRLTRPRIPAECTHNAHMFYIKVSSLEERTRLISHLKEGQVSAVFHYIPLHSSPAGGRFGVFTGEDKYTTTESEKLLRLPLYFGITPADVDHVIEKIRSFFSV